MNFNNKYKEKFFKKFNIIKYDDNYLENMINNQFQTNNVTNTENSYITVNTFDNYLNYDFNIIDLNNILFNESIMNNYSNNNIA